MPGLVELYQEKWFRKVSAAKDRWLAMVRKADSLDAYVKGISTVTGLPESVVRASFPARNWAEFQRNAEKYVDIWLGKIRAAYERRKWAEKYVAAFKG